MLQPLQLEEVLGRYAADIAEVRAFLAKAGLPVDTEAALGSLAARLQKDSGFRRDLASHIWLLVYRWGPQIGFPDLLGVLALAAAGPHFAARAEDADAHAVLRFVVAARSSLERETREAPAIPVQDPPMATAARISTAHARTANAQRRMAGDASGMGAREPVREPARRQTESTQAPAPRRRSAVLLAAAACVLSALLGGWWVYRHPAAGKSGAVPAASETAEVPLALPSEPVDPVVRGPAPIEEAGTTPALPQPTRKTTAAAPARSAAETSAGRLPLSALSPAHGAVGASVASGSSVASDRATSAPAMSASSPPVSSTPAAAPVVPRAGTAGRSQVPIPAATLSRRLDSPTMPAYTAQDEVPAIPGRPRLLRRPPRSTGPLAENDAELVAEVRPSDAPARSAGNRGGTGRVTPAGIVRPATLGTMAANILYSPVPQYPAEASSAHVQGQVKVQAQVGTDGSVISARVVSGPPLLRDAALDAVQHWRYAPYVSAGKPIRMSAVAVMDFELP